ncbi:NADP-dependent oxidoreductase [Chitinophaga oryzae]|uniref:NADP-dependent oxidoreductase n=1 Tax=Chitinophaga oryzae TaxID=2725414 RepID=A0AAE6ZJT1_9BACT|nr:NADP-dependent oxidoreductase [Chitinophaga oryzae]QJB34536.1 NADP-dependent oxidoreductase [Chitinophaga oryzae]QJB41055.1 NADP-dependent oxidoreductase [Chitinophaga oryzae]
MKAIRIYEFGEPEVMKIVEVERPVPAPDEILVKVYAASVNPADYIIRRGGNEGLKPLLKLPMGLGIDGAGIVEAIGSEVTKFKIGDRVYGVPNYLDGSYTEYLAAKSDQFALMPQSVSFNEAGSLPACARMAWSGMVEKAKIKPGQHVLVHGAAGGIGNLALQFAKAHGAYVIGTASAYNADFLKQLGADDVIDYNTQKFEDIVRDMDVVFNATPTTTVDEALRLRSVKVLREGGIFVCTHGVWPGDEFKELLARKNATVSMAGVDINHYHCLTEVAKLIDAGKVKPVISRIYPWEQAAEAHRDSETKHVRGKIVLQVRKED